MARDPWDVKKGDCAEFYASYVATLLGSISKRSKPLAQDPLTSTLVRWCPMDISPATIRRFLYGLLWVTPRPSMAESLTTEMGHCAGVGAFRRNSEQCRAVILWLAVIIAEMAKRRNGSFAPRLGIIRRLTLTFVAKFFPSSVRIRCRHKSR
ncbi:hypothetical protein H5410_030058 [Solanum commersonii]|uniref:Uncharacterized protein n=1 Tax=Solanum commersonii TaxID=4109 RepID=A0A9J5YGD2_SOLCO|nr:hypothetical protein H5410_030058 [Solanum commersonii]